MLTFFYFSALRQNFANRFYKEKVTTFPHFDRVAIAFAATVSSSSECSQIGIRVQDNTVLLSNCVRN